MIEKSRLDLGIGGRGMPGKTLLVKGTSAADFAVLRDVYGFVLDPITKDTLMFPTLLSAIAACRAGLGDHIMIAPGHTESLTTAAAIAANIAGITIEGMGVGNNRPVFTFASSDNSATFTVTADNVKIKNIIGTTTDDGLTNAFVVTGNNCEIDIEWQDPSAAVEAATVIRLDTADNAKVKLKYNGFTAGNAAVSVIRLDDCDNVKIEIDAYGIVSTAWVEMVDVASTNVSVRGRLYTHGITNFSRDVVDTITASIWDADIFDVSAGFKVSGGSAAALASDDASGIAAALAVPSADVATNVNSRDVVGNKTDAGVQAIAADKSLVGYVKGLVDMVAGTAGVAAFPAAAAPANAVSLAEVIRAIYDRQLGDGTNTNTNGLLGKKVTRSAADIFDGTTKALFNVTLGRVLMTHIELEVTTAAIDASASNTKLQYNPTVGTTGDLCANLDINADEINTLYTIAGAPATALLEGTGGNSQTMSVTGVVLAEGAVELVTSADVGTGGALGKAEMWYFPLDDTATVAAA